MIYRTTYSSPIGELVLASQNGKLIGIWNKEQKYDLSKFQREMMEKDNDEILKRTKNWLDCYFRLEQPKIETLDIQMIGSEFQIAVWKLLCEIPYGEVVTYGELAKKIACQTGVATMSAQAIGGAVGHNPISIVVPCHRVVGSNRNLTGYAGGVDKKVELLKLEGIDISQYSLPKKG